MTAVRTVSNTKTAFFNAYPRPISALYQRIVEELLVDLHLVTVNADFVYDPFFALGLVTVFNNLMESYLPPDQIPVIFSAFCKALQLKPEVLQQDAKTLQDLMQYGDRQQRLLLLKRQPEAEDVGGLRAILDRLSGRNYYYSRILLLGVYTSFETVAAALYPDLEERTQHFLTMTTDAYGFSAERVKKDLQLYRSALNRMKQVRAVAEEMVKAARRQQERRQSAPGASPPKPEPDNSNQPGSV